MLAFLAFPSFWIGLVILAALLACEAFENGIASMVVFVVSIAGIHFFSDVDVVHYVRDNAGQLLWYVVLYLVLGVFWSGFKWYLYVTDQAEKYQELKDAFFKSSKAEDKQAAWREEVKDRPHTYRDFPPQVKENKARITRWLSCWVTSVLWTLCNDFLTGVFKRITQMVSATFQRISDRVFAKFKADFN